MPQTGDAPLPADVPRAIADIIDAPRTPGLSLSPDRRYLLFLETPPLPPIEELAQGELRLAGVRIHPQNNAASRAAYCTGLMLKDLARGEEQLVSGLPEHPRVQHVQWSPNSRHIAFALVGQDHCELWSVDVATATAQRLCESRLNLTAGDPIDWLPDSRGLVCLCVLDSRGAAPSAPLHVKPTVQESGGRAAPARTFQDLLKNPHDEELFDYYFHSQPMLVGLGEAEDRVPRPLGPPGIYLHATPSPNGKYLLVSSLHRPYSYIVPASRFPRRTEIWEIETQQVIELADLPLAEEVPVTLDAVRAGPRGFGWRADAAATVYWVEAGDGGDPAIPADVRDRLFAWSGLGERDARSEPAALKDLTIQPVVLAELAMRLHGVAWGDGGLAMVRESWWKNRRERMWRIQPDDPAAPRDLLWDRSTEDRYGDPGRPLLERNAAGLRVIMSAADPGAVYLVGEGAGEEGNRPFLDGFDLAVKQATRIWQSSPPWYESPVTFLDAARTQLLYSREKSDEPTNYFVNTIAGTLRVPSADFSKRRIADGKRSVPVTEEPSPQAIPKRSDCRITSFPHPTPELKDVAKEILRYRRADGVTCTATLYLPQGYTPADGPLPALLWAYPTEYKSAEHAAQLNRSPHRFIRVYPYSPLLWLTQGFAVLDGPTMPIVGEGDIEPNDTYVEQLIASAEAAVGTLVERGVTAPGRVAIGGHSYGAFMTANLLAHTDLFAAGIGMSGSYNRTLTPFGFQSEERTLWQAPDVYARMSPFMQADKIKRPLLLIHGEADENVGTWPQQSERFFQALKGLGATARLVLLPHEGHGYQARETMYHVAHEIWRWLQRHVA